MNQTSQVQIANHPLVHHKLVSLRDQATPSPLFRQLVHEISQVLFYLATQEVALRPVTLQTPMMPTTGQLIAEKIVFVPVLRAGLGMANALQATLPEASVWHLGIERDHGTLQPKTYYNRLPSQHQMDLAFVLDPMLATGGSAIHAIDVLKLAKVPKIVFIGLIGAPEGIAALQAAHGDVPIYLAARDERLNEKGYILPGLGDAGDRQFGTQPA